MVTSSLLLSGCGGDSSTNGSSEVPNRSMSPSIQEVVTHNADMAYAVYSDTVSTAKTLSSAIKTFVAKPAPNTADLNQLKTLWLAAREPYGLSEVWRFQKGPIDALREDGTMGLDGEGPEGRINAWPLGEALIDYVASGPIDGDHGPENAAVDTDVKGNIISDSSITISKSSLSALNEIGGDGRNIATGYHAIEFLLWGQDLNQGVHSWTSSRDGSGGQRPASDYNTSGGCTSGLNASGIPSVQNDSVCQRRKNYLQTAATLLVDALSPVQQAWSPIEAGNHYHAFIAGGKTSLAKILEAMGRLGFGELAGDRMGIALATHSQEDEQSCFSDNTHRDIFLDAQGIVNTYTGRYTQVDGTVLNGPGVNALLVGTHATLGDKMQTALDTTMERIRVIDLAAKSGNPFDNQIRSTANGGNQADRNNIQAAISALAEQTDVIQTVMEALGLTPDDLR
ncbi:MAG: metalloproteinase [Gammaproteobacteria bacterium]|nr:metalloproteinase [Gammaproteobacteria bacterium]